MVILESHLSGRAFGRELEMDLLEPLGRAMVVVLGFYGLLRLDLLFTSGALALAVGTTYEARMFQIEYGLGVVLPVLLLSIGRVRRSRNGLVMGAFLAVLGFVMHRLNVSITGLERASGTRYIPSWMELTVSLGLVAIGFAVFALAARYLPIFPERAHDQARLASEEPRAALAAGG
jgi:Ni/Fe-hydrogenase subunit HybB-like protein